MAIQYEIHSIHNAQGNGEERKYVRLKDHEPMTPKQIEQHIEQACTLTRGDVQAVMTSLHDLIVTELSKGARFFILVKKGALNAPIYFLTTKEATI